MDALVAGGTGFIGSELVRHLIAVGYQVTVIARRHENALLPGNIRVIVDTTSHPLENYLCGRKYEKIFNLAAYGVDPKDRDVESMLSVNIAFANRLVGLAPSLECKGYVHVGTSAEYDGTLDNEFLQESAPVESRRLYGATKAAATLSTCAVATSTGLPFAVVRLFNVYGEQEQQHRLLPTIWRNLRSGKRAPLSHGNQTRDFLYVRDVVEGLLAIAEVVTAKTERSPFIINLCSGVPVTVRKFAEQVALTMGVSAKFLGFGDYALRPDETMRVVGSTKRLEQITDWRPRWSLAMGIQNSIDQLNSCS